MQNTTDKDDKHDKDKQDGSKKPVKQNHVGDETPNPLPEDDYTSKQPLGDDSQANSDPDSAVQ